MTNISCSFRDENSRLREINWFIQDHTINALQNQIISQSFYYSGIFTLPVPFLLLWTSPPPKENGSKVFHEIYGVKFPVKETISLLKLTIK